MTPQEPPTEPPTVVGLGEVLWDVFEDEARFGGAPANFASHAAALGARAFMVSAVGDDALGRRARETLRALGVNTEAVASIADAPTGTVEVRLDAQGRPQYTIHRGVAWDQIPWTRATQTLARETDAVCFGTLAQREETSRRTIHRFLEAVPSACLRVLDINLRQAYYSRSVIEQSLRRCDVLKLNDGELPVLAEMFELAGDEESSLSEQLIDRFDLHHVVVTLGERGAMLAGPSGQVSARSKPVQVRDTVGAGDAFTAAVTMGLLAGSDLQALARYACDVAGYVCTQAGAVPALPDRLRQFPAED